jgi:heat shock protein HtpX
MLLNVQGQRQDATGLEARLSSLFWTVILLAGLLGLAGGAGFLLAGRAGAIGAMIVAVMSSYAAARYADFYVLRAFRAEPISPWEAPDLWRLLHGLADRAGVPVPRLWLIHSERPNAFTVGRGPRSASIAVTSGLLQKLDFRNLAGVLAHEVAHIQHRDILLASFAATVTSLLASLARVTWLILLFTFPLFVLWAPKALLGAALLGVTPVLALLLQAAISRQREYAADATASRLTGDPLGLAHALHRLQEFENARRSLLRLLFRRPQVEEMGSPLQTHPPTRERIDRLVAMAG